MINHHHNEEPAGVYAKDLWYIVDSVKANFMIDSNGHDSTFFKWAMDGYRDLTLANVVKEAVRTKFIPLPPEYEYLLGETVIEPGPELGFPLQGPQPGWPGRTRPVQFRFNLPADFIDYYTIGAVCGRHIQPLDYNENIYPDLNIPICNETGEGLNPYFQQDQLCGCGEGGIPGNSGGGYPYWDWGWGSYWKNGQFVAGEYGRSGYRYRGAFTIDWATRQIVLDRCTHPKEGIVITYQSNGIGTGNACILDTQVSALVAYVEWKKTYYEISNKPAREKSKLDTFFITKAERQYQKEVTRTNARRNAMTKNEIHNSVLRAIRQSPKR